MNLQELQTKKAQLVRRATELSEKAEFTQDDKTEVESLTKSLNEIKGQIEETEALNRSRHELKASLVDLAKLDATVQTSARPASVVASEIKSLSSPQFRFGVLDRNRLPEVDLTEEDVKVLKKDGYSENTIQNCATKSYTGEFNDYLRSGGRQLPPMVLKSMTESGAGGVLVPIQWGELITNPPMSGMLRSRVRNMSVNTLMMRYPRVQTTNPNYPAYPVQVSWGGEQPTAGQNPDQGANFNTTNIDIQVNEVYAQGLFSISLLEDNAYSLSSYIPTLFQESLDVDLDQKIISGTGTANAASPQPYGINEANVVPLVNATTTGATAAIKYQDLVNLMYRLPQQYRTNAVWLMNSRTLGIIAGLVDGQQRPLFLPNFGYIGDTAGGGANWSSGTILGRPFMISENMPDVAQGNVSIYFADFERLYFLLTRVGPTVRILDQPQFTAGNYIFALRSRTGGRVVQPYAGDGLKHV